MISKSQKFWSLPYGLIQSSDNVKIMEYECVFVCVMDEHLHVYAFLCVNADVYVSQAPCGGQMATWQTLSVSSHIPPCLRQGLLVFCCLGPDYEPMSFSEFSFLPPISL